MERHRSSLPREQLEIQISNIVNQLVIPKEWHEIILAYYLSDDGMSRFELEGFNLRSELSRHRELFRLDHISQATYEEFATRINRELRKLRPSAHPAATQAHPLITDFPSIWSQMNLTERRVILKTIFNGLYFDSQSALRKATFQSPFDRLLSVTHKFADNEFLVCTERV